MSVITRDGAKVKDGEVKNRKKPGVKECGTRGNAGAVERKPTNSTYQAIF
jgi:hypothetical protein